MSIRISHVDAVCDYSSGNQECLFQAIESKEEQLVKIAWQLTDILWLAGNLLSIVEWKAQSAARHTIKQKNYQHLGDGSSFIGCAL